MEDNLNHLFEMVTQRAHQARQQDPFCRVREVYNPNWDEVPNKIYAVGEASDLGQKVGNHYAHCRRPDCYWPKLQRTAYATAAFFKTVLTTLLREFSDNEEARAITELWGTIPDERLEKDLRYQAFRCSYDMILINAQAQKQQIVEPTCEPRVTSQETSSN